MSALSRVLRPRTLETLRSISPNFVAMYSNSADIPKFETLAVSVPKQFVYHVQLNRPDKLNAMNRKMWLEVGECFQKLGDNADCRAIVLSAAGRLFTAGIDLKDFAKMGPQLAEIDDVARRCRMLEKTIQLYQDSISSLEKCPKPVICAVHDACIGAGVNLITAADIRWCTNNAWFQVREVAIGMAADVGVLQRLPKVVGNDSLVRELAFTGRKFVADEAKEFGMVSKVFETKESMVEKAVELAEEISGLSPVAVQLTKRNLVYSRDHSVQEGLDHIRIWNQTMLQSEDFLNATMAQATKSPPPTFSKL
ncbi:hypothetical protein R5R35_008663 [Gryllus longicercus]|uniref:Delta(3,5)-Delta(2,4)-dienoyl-CoA isomerase, mitochondrial n=1 Tax=Gryllus longicercus TaxID=2509291 RepID=A0AAN9VLI0_9ORTH